MIQFDLLIENICEDFREPICYLPAAAVISILLLLGAVLYNHIAASTKSRAGRINLFSFFLCTVYIVVILNLAFFSREPGSRQGIDLKLFGTWNDSPVAQAYFIENILMFIPLGLLFPMTFQVFRKWYRCILTGALFSVMIELTQLAAKRGYCQLDDVLTNVFGTVLGWGIWFLADSVKSMVLGKKKPDKSRQKDS